MQVHLDDALVQRFIDIEHSAAALAYNLDYHRRDMQRWLQWRWESD